MALWSRGRSPDTTSTEDHANAYRSFRQREEKAYLVCAKCKFCREIQPTINNIAKYNCSKIKQTRYESGSIVSALYGKQCIKNQKKKV